MSEILRKPERLRLQGICKIPAGKAGKAAAKQYANERKARKRALAQLATADSKAGIGLLVMLNLADREFGRYIFKKLDKVIPFYVRALSDGKSGMPAEEMSWLMDACEKRGYRTLWLDLAGTEKIDKKAVLHLVVGELIRVLEEPSLSAEKEAGDMVEAYAVQAEPETEEKTETVNEAAESPVVVEEILTTEEKPAVTEEPATEESATEEAPAVEAKPAEEEKSAAEEKTVTEEKSAAEEEPVPEEKPAPRRRSRKTSTKPEGEKAPAKPRRKREPAAPLTVEATLAKRRRQMGLE